MLKEAKLYLKTSYRGHCQEESRCPDHCRAFALSVPNDADYRTDCSHDHDFSCRDCEALKEVIQEIQFAIAKYSSKINDKEKEDDLRHDAVTAEVKVREWKAHIMRAHNQEQSKQKILLSLLRDESFYNIRLGNEVFANQVPRKAVAVVCEKRNKVAHMQCRC